MNAEFKEIAQIPLCASVSSVVKVLIRIRPRHRIYLLAGPSAQLSRCPVWRISWTCARSSSKFEFR
jgi:hypothetical protein